MVNTNHLQLVVSLYSYLSIMNDFYILECCKFVGVMCCVDFYFIKKTDMRIHHVLAIGMCHYMNNHSMIESIKEISTIALSTEISSIFLMLNEMLDKDYVTLNIVNKIAFISTFLYYRIYNFSYLLFDKNVQSAFYIYSKNNFEYCEIYISLYGMFILNLYWGYLIFKKIIRIYNKIE